MIRMTLNPDVKKESISYQNEGDNTEMQDKRDKSPNSSGETTVVPGCHSALLLQPRVFMTLARNRTIMKIKWKQDNNRESS